MNTLYHIVPPEDIIGLSFDSITTSFGSLLSLWPGGTVTDFKFETALRNHRIASFFSPSILPQYTTLSHLLHHFKLFKNICSSSHLETTVTSIQKFYVTTKLAFSCKTNVVDIRKNNDSDSALSLRTNATSIRWNDVSTKLALSRKTNVADIRKNNDSDSALSLRTNATSIRKDNVAAKFALSRKTNVADVFKNNRIESALSLRTNATSIRKNNVPA